MILFLLLLSCGSSGGEKRNASPLVQESTPTNIEVKNKRDENKSKEEMFRSLEELEENIREEDYIKLKDRVKELGANPEESKYAVLGDRVYLVPVGGEGNYAAHAKNLYGMAQDDPIYGNDYIIKKEKAKLVAKASAEEEDNWTGDEEEYVSDEEEWSDNETPMAVVGQDQDNNELDQEAIAENALGIVGTLRRKGAILLGNIKDGKFRRRKAKNRRKTLSVADIEVLKGTGEGGTGEGGTNK